MDHPKILHISRDGLLCIKSMPNVAVIDVRDEERKSDGHIAGSIHYFSITVPLRLRIIAEAIKDKDVVVFYCDHSKRRGPSCARDLALYLHNVVREKKRVGILEHGFSGWEGFGYPVCHCRDVPCRVVDETKVRKVPRVVEDQAKIQGGLGMIDLTTFTDIPNWLKDQAQIPPESQQPQESESNTDIDTCAFLDIPELPDSEES